MARTGAAIDRSLRIFAWGNQKGLCFYCRRFVPKAQATLDHRVPRALGGESSGNNTVMACEVCNQAKGDLREGDFMDVLNEFRQEMRQA